MRAPHAAMLLLLTVASERAIAQDSGQQQFIIRKGKDTIAVERFTRDAGTLQGQLSQSNGVKMEYVANLRPDHSVEHIELSRQGLQGYGHIRTTLPASARRGAPPHNPDPTDG